MHWRVMQLHPFYLEVHLPACSRFLRGTTSVHVLKDDLEWSTGICRLWPVGHNLAHQGIFIACEELES